MKKLIMTFDSNGGVKMESKGFTGNACLSESLFMKDALGISGKPQMTREAGIASKVVEGTKAELRD